MTMQSVSVSALSTEYLRYPINATVNGVSYDPTVDVVQFSLPVHGVTPATWYTGSWEVDVASGQVYARVLVGPAGGVVTVTQGIVYDVFTKIFANPETPVIPLGQLVVT